MRSRLVLSFLVAWGGCHAAALDATAAPQLVKSTPATGDDQVDPGLAELRFEFDQDMDPSGFSVCGGGKKFPALKPAKGPRWASARVFVIPVRLEPDHDYEFSLNCPSAQSFRSAAGDSLAATPITFRTRAADPNAPVPAFDAKAAIAALRRAIDDNYAHRDLHPVDWDARLPEFLPRLTAAQRPREFAKIAAELLSATGDLHVWVESGDERFAAGHRDVAPNANARLLKRLVPDWQQPTKAIAHGRFEDGIVYLAIASWSLEPDDLRRALGAFASSKDAAGIVLDMRFNSGGSELAARELAGCFFQRPTPYAKHRVRDPEAEGGFQPEVTRTLQPNKPWPAL